MTNSLVNRAGITFCYDMQEELGAGVRDIAGAYAVARNAFMLRELWEEIEAAQEGISVRSGMHAVVQQFLERVMVWILRHNPLPLDIEAAAKKLSPAMSEMKTLLPPAKTLVEKIAGLERMAAAPDIMAVAQKTKQTMAAAGKVYFSLGETLNIDWLCQSASAIAGGSHWEKLAGQSLLGDFYDEQQRLAQAALTAKGGADAWLAAQSEKLEKLERFTQELQSLGQPDLPKLMLALKHVRMV